MENCYKCRYGSPLMKTISDEQPQHQKAQTESHIRQITIITKSLSSYINPDSEIANRGTFYYKLEMYDKAIEDFERGLDYFKNDEKYNRNILETSILLGICYLNKNNISKSTNLFNKVFDLRNINDELENGWGYICKGVNYYSIGDINKACEYFKKANNIKGNIQEMIGGVVCEIVQKCKCDGISFIDEDQENEDIEKIMRDMGLL